MNCPECHKNRDYDYVIDTLLRANCNDTVGKIGDTP